MGLPIWVNPDDQKPLCRAAKTAGDTTSRSVNRRARRTSRAYISRETTALPPRFERSPPPSQGFNGLRSPARPGTRGVPPITTLLESAERQSRALRLPVPSPPPAPETEDELSEARRRTSRAPLQIPESRRRDLPSPFPVWGADTESGPTPGSWTRYSAGREPGDAAHRYLLRFARNLRQRRAGRPQGSIPSPPLDVPDAEDTLFVPGPRPQSPGADWEVMHSTIAPDTTLPSADSSFTSAAASQSFSASLASHSSGARNRSSTLDHMVPMYIDETHNEVDFLDEEAVRERFRRQSSTTDIERVVTDFATSWYVHEAATVQGCERIVAFGGRSGTTLGAHLVASTGEFRWFNAELVRHCLRTDPMRLFRFARSQNSARQACLCFFNTFRPFPYPTEGSEEEEDYATLVLFALEEYFRYPTSVESRLSYQSSAANAQDATSDAQEATTDTQELSTDTQEAAISPSSPISPTSPASEHAAVDWSFTTDMQLDDLDLDVSRRVIQRLAARADVPEEWWSSMGLSFSRPRPRAALDSTRRAALRRPAEVEVAGHRVTRSRIERRNPRL